MKSYDVAVIGGGLIGLCCARWLSKEGLRVVLLERHRVGREASSAAAGMLAPHFEAPMNPQLFLLGLQSLRLFPDLSEGLFEETGIDVGYDRHGTLALYFDSEEFAQSKSKHRWQVDMGAQLQWLTREEVLRQESTISDELVGALYIPNDHQVDNCELVRALLEALIQSGVHIYEDHPVTEVLVEDGRVIGVRSESEKFASRWVINAAGCWAGDIVPQVWTPVRPVRGQMVALDMRGIAHIRHVLHAHRIYLVPRRNGHLLVGATVEEAGFENKTTVGGIAALLTQVVKISAKMREMPVVATWSGLRPGSRDDLPMLGPTEIEGYLLATGHFRNGILLAPITAQLLRDYIVSEEISELVKPFLVERFTRANDDGGSNQWSGAQISRAHERRRNSASLEYRTS